MSDRDDKELELLAESESYAVFVGEDDDGEKSAEFLKFCSSAEE